MDISRAVELAKAGDNNGYAYLYNQTYQKSYYVALKFLKNEQNAMDVLQDSYIKAFSSLEQLQEPEKFESWLARIVATRSLNELKKNNPVLFSQNDEDENILDSFEDDRVDTRPDIAIDQQETARLINEMLADLSEEQRVCITMYYMQEMSVKEIAEVLSVSENTVKSRLNYGRNKIKDKVLELEKKGIKLYGLLPMAFFLFIFKSEAMACEVTSPVFGEILKSVSSTGKVNVFSTEATSAKLSSASSTAATSTAVAKGGLAIAGITLSAKVLIASVAIIGVIGGGVAYGINKSNDSYATDEEQNYTNVQPDDTNDGNVLTSEDINDEENSVELYEFPENAIPITTDTRAVVWGFKSIEELPDGSYVMNAECCYYYQEYLIITQEEISSLQPGAMFSFKDGINNETLWDVYCYKEDNVFYYFISDYEYEDVIEFNYSIKDIEENCICYRIPKNVDNDKYTFEGYECNEWKLFNPGEFYENVKIVIRPDAHIVVDKFDNETFEMTDIDCNMSEFYAEEYDSWVDSLDNYALGILAFNVSGSEDGRASELLYFPNAE